MVPPTDGPAYVCWKDLRRGRKSNATLGRSFGAVKVKRVLPDLRPTHAIVRHESVPGGHDHRW